MEGYLNEIMRQDPRRRFAFGISIENVQMTLWHGDRSGLVVAKLQDFTVVSSASST